MDLDLINEILYIALLSNHKGASMKSNKVNQGVLKVAETIERYLIIVLLFSLLLIVLYTTVVFLILLFGGIMSGIQNSFSMENNILVHLHKVFGGFLSVLIGIELLHTIKMYLKDDVVHVEVVLLVALVGISRHAIDLDLAHMDPMSILAMSALVVSLSLGYYLIKKVIRHEIDHSTKDIAS